MDRFRRRRGSHQGRRAAVADACWADASARHAYAHGERGAEPLAQLRGVEADTASVAGASPATPRCSARRGALEYPLSREQVRQVLQSRPEEGLAGTAGQPTAYTARPPV